MTRVRVLLMLMVLIVCFMVVMMLDMRIRARQRVCVHEAAQQSHFCHPTIELAPSWAPR